MASIYMMQTEVYKERLRNQQQAEEIRLLKQNQENKKESEKVKKQSALIKKQAKEMQNMKQRMRKLEQMLNKLMNK